mgnify:CR=1 FL=1
MRRSYPPASVIGCLHHFEEPEKKQQMQELHVLPFVPLENTEATFNMLYDNLHDDLLELTKYFKHLS